MRGRTHLSVILGLAVAALAPGQALGASIVVTTTVDEYDIGGTPACGLREAIEAANTDGVFGGCSVADEGDDTIVLQAATYLQPRTTINQGNEDGEFNVAAEDVHIQGNGATIQGTGVSPGDRVFRVEEGLTMESVTIRSGFRVGGAGGGVQLFADEPSDHFACTGCTFTANHAGSQGGAIANTDGELVLENTTVSGNTANGAGGGIDTDGTGITTINNSTVTLNTADADATGGAMDRGGGIAAGFGGTATLSNTIVAGNIDPTGGAAAAPDCDKTGLLGGIVSDGHTLIGDDSNCEQTPGTGDVTGVDPMLAPLAANGGPTQSHALTSGTPAHNAGDPAAPSGTPACEPTDQRGVARPQSGRCDIGAFELAPPATPVDPPATPPTTPKKCKKGQKLKKGKCVKKKRKKKK